MNILDPNHIKVHFLSNTFVTGFVIFVIILFVLPWLIGKFMVYKKFLSYLKDNKKEVFARLVESTNFRAMGMFSRDWISYIDSPTDTEDPYIVEMKRKSLLVF